MKAIISLSGGPDSTTLLYKYQDDIKMSVFFQYGGRLNEQEVKWSKYHSEKLGKEFHIINLEESFKLFESRLLKTGQEVPNEEYPSEGESKCVVPSRNMIFLSILSGLAESRGCDTIMIANHKNDHGLYPDCNPEFIEAMTKAIKLGSGGRIDLIAPFTNMWKRDILSIGAQLGVLSNETYSCYKGTPKHCGVCPSCRSRKKAFREAGILDFTEYEE